MSAKNSITPVEDKHTEEKILERISDFLINNKKPLLIILAAVVLAIAIVLVSLSIVNNNKAAMLLEIDSLEARYQNLLQQDDTTDDYSANLETLKNDLNILAEKGGSSYPVIKANYLLGSLAAEKENWENAEAYFQKAYEIGTKFYTAPLALINVGVALEEQGKVDEALKTYVKVWDEFGTDSAVGAKALFSQARIYDNQGDSELAKALFNQLIDNFPNSDYSKIAKNQVIYL